jgi:hypothetical protein
MVAPSAAAHLLALHKQHQSIAGMYFGLGALLWCTAAELIGAGRLTQVGVWFAGVQEAAKALAEARQLLEALLRRDEETAAQLPASMAPHLQELGGPAAAGEAQERLPQLAAAPRLMSRELLQLGAQVGWCSSPLTGVCSKEGSARCCCGSCVRSFACSNENRSSAAPSCIQG